MGVITILLAGFCFALLLPQDAPAQKKQDPKKKSALSQSADTLVRTSTKIRRPMTDRSNVAVEYLPTADYWIEVDTTEAYKRVLRQVEANRLPEPLIAAHYLIEYPKEAQEQKIEGAVKFTVRVKEGKVINSQIDRSDNVLLNNAVLDVANRLQFDLSWHTPDKQEFFYTKEVVFELPDTIFARP